MTVVAGWCGPCPKVILRRVKRLSRLVASLGTIDFWFIAENRRIHKTVHHFLMEAAGGELSDTDAEVDQVAWVNVSDLRQRLAYADERRLLDRLPDFLAGAG